MLVLWRFSNTIGKEKSLAMTPEQIQEQAEKYIEDNYSDYYFKEMLEDIFIEGAKWMQEQEKWISVDDRLPKNFDNILCYLKNSHIVICTFHKKVKSFQVCHTLKEVTDNNPVTHWMPLPQPPKQD